MPNIELIDEVVTKSSNRRGMLKRLGIAGAALSALGISREGRLRAASTAPTPEEVVQFALNLEYLEAEFYSVATTGKTLEERGVDVSGQGNSGPTKTAYGKVSFGNNLLFTGTVANDIAADEMNHVLVLRQALMSNGVTPIAKPAINLDALAAKGASLANEASFLTLSRIFEDIGLSAYCGGAPYLSGSPYLQNAARITGVEGLHVSNIRLQMARLGLPSPTLDGADVPPPPSGTNFFSTNLANGLCAVRTPGQVLYLAYGNVAGVTKGGFFPSGVNGSLNTSSSPATSAGLATNPS